VFPNCELGSRGRSALRALTFAIPAALALSPSRAEAQAQTFYLDRLIIAGAPDDGLAVWRPQMGEKTRFFGQFGLGFALNPLRADNHFDDLNKSDFLAAPVSAQLVTYFNAGVEVMDRFSFQASFPLALYQTGNPTTNPSAGVDGQAVDLKPIAPMDLRLDGRFIVFRNEPRTFKLGVLGSIFLPAGNKYSFGSDGAVSGALGLAAEYDAKSFFVVLNGGVRLRPTRQLNELQVSHELTYGLAAYVPLRKDTMRVGAEFWGATGIGSANAGDLDTSPFEWMLSGRMFLNQKKSTYVGLGAGTRLTGGYAPDFRSLAVLGGSFSVGDSDARSPGFRYVIDKDVDTDNDGIPDLVDMCPSDPEDRKPPNTDDGCPTLPDRDGDGIPDISDKCPDVKEDFDGIDDRDGCPEDDADKDGVPDSEDKCPKEPGEVSEDPGKNGCPQFIRRITGSAQIQILKQVQFKFDSATILPTSFPILDEVVRLLTANPEIKLVRIEGHTDRVGTDEYNDRLSNERAQSVRQYLIKRGIDPNRLTAIGHGSRKPIADNETDQGRQKNRRVEFHIEKQAIEGR